jgi:hypothetical protein
MLRALAFCLVLGIAAPASAQTVVVLTSKAPYWKVGTRDDALSRACGLGRFTMQRSGAYVAKFVGKEGPGMLGVAKGTGLNLYDPGKKAKPKEDYFFHDHGTTSCQVYVGGRKGKPPA